MKNARTVSACWCGEIHYGTLFPAGNYTIVRCIACGQARTMTPKHIGRKQTYQTEDLAVYTEHEAMFRRLFRDLLRFVRRYKREGILLDIGAGVGLLLSEAQKLGYRVIGFEPSLPSVRQAKKFGIPLIPSEFRPKLVRHKVDIVIVNHVLEHLANPPGIIGDIRSVLAPDGILVIGLPNFGSFLAQAKRDRWQSLIPDQHRWHFTIFTLDSLLTKQGFRRIGLTSFDHDRSTHPLWKRPFYAILDTISRSTQSGEAILAVYELSA